MRVTPGPTSRRTILLFAGVLALATLPVQASDNAMLAGQRLAANCAACHGTNGATVGSAFRPLAGMPREAIVESMQAFRNGSRPATIMHQLSKGYTDQQIAAMAAFFAAQKK